MGRGGPHLPGGAHVALIFTINIEYWEPFRPGQKEPLFAGGPATIPHALPGDVLDTANWTWREYGQRVGIWRLMEVFDAAGVAPSCTCNGMILTERRRIVDAVKERGWELVPHNWAQTDLLTDYAHKPDEERAVIRRTFDTYERVVGKPAKAWLSSAIRGTPHTPAFLKEFGLIAYCDYLNDDQPYLIDTVHVNPCAKRAGHQMRRRNRRKPSFEIGRRRGNRRGIPSPIGQAHQAHARSVAWIDRRVVVEQ